MSYLIWVLDIDLMSHNINTKIDVEQYKGKCLICFTQLNF